ncbi:hypothetical protein NUW54_g3311 [Trametes sanguinea]|uniref:Uncharacterized protein n=1 Tax=Trametes sanguinea TaxID=158606 RepID=A0ACC1Q300_9APHY|nr:hypothetical protein NUW54_g3311 [Trametes sanguinea]
MDSDIPGGPSDWSTNLPPVWATADTGSQQPVPPQSAWPQEPLPQPQVPQPGPGEPLSETEVIRELLRSISTLGLDAVQTRTVLVQQSALLERLQDQFFRSSQDSVELTRRVADHAASAFRNIASTAPATQGSVRQATVKVREPRMFSGRADDVEPFLREVRTAIQLQQAGFPTDELKTMYMSLYLKSGAAESWYNAVSVSQPHLLTDFDAFVREFIKRFQTTDLAAKYLTKIEALRQTGSAASYANQFLECLAYLNWTEETKLTQMGSDCHSS